MSDTIKLNFNKSLFGPMYDALQKTNHSGKRYIISRGSRGSGKSHATAQYVLTRCFENKERVLILRKTAVSMKHSVVKLLDDLLLQWGIRHLWEYNKQDMTFTNRVNGSEIYCKGLDDPDRIKSIQGITFMWMEEATEISEVDFDTVNLSLRGRKNQQIIMTFNPISKTNWIYKRFFDNTLLNDKCHKFKTTYLDNPYLDEDFIDSIERYKEYDYNYFQVMGLGNWGSLTTGFEFYKSFRPEKNVSVVKYNPELPLHLSWDENVNPYLSCLISQIDGNTIKVIDEVCAEDPWNTLKDACDMILQKYSDHSTGVFIYGDSTSVKRDTKLERGYNFFYLVLEYLKSFHTTSRVGKSNPPVVVRGDFINQIFFGFHSIKIIIDPKCVKTINDLQEVKQDPDGKKFKKKIRDPKTGLSMEMVGHLSDCLDYQVCQAFPKEFDNFRAGGKINIPTPKIKQSQRW